MFDLISSANPSETIYYRYAYANVLAPSALTLIAFVDTPLNGLLGDETHTTGNLDVDDIYVFGQTDPLSDVKTYIINYDYRWEHGYGVDADFLTIKSGPDFYYVPLELGVIFLLGDSDESGFDGDLVRGNTEALTYTEIAYEIPDGGGSALGSSEHDVIRGSRWHDTIFAGDGDDVVTGLRGNDYLAGEGGNDFLRGHKWQDILDGGDGDDRLEGGSSRDVLFDGAGADKLYGGSGHDTFVMSADGDTDAIMDFRTDWDRINLSEFGVPFSALEMRDTASGFVEVDIAGEILLITDGHGTLKAADLTIDHFVFLDLL